MCLKSSSPRRKVTAHIRKECRCMRRKLRSSGKTGLLSSTIRPPWRLPIRSARRVWTRPRCCRAVGSSNPRAFSWSKPMPFWISSRTSRIGAQPWKSTRTTNWFMKLKRTIQWVQSVWRVCLSNPKRRNSPKCSCRLRSTSDKSGCRRTRTPSAFRKTRISRVTPPSQRLSPLMAKRIKEARKRRAKRGFGVVKLTKRTVLSIIRGMWRCRRT